MEGPGPRIRLIALAAAAAVATGLAAGGAAAPTPSPGPALAFADATHGWAAGRGGILRTDDAGATWRLQRPGRVTALDAADADTALALAGRTLLATSGSGWRAVRAPGLAAIDAVDTHTAFGLTPAGALLSTLVAGAHWTRRPAAGRADALCFATPRRGWVARGGTVRRTTDGGASWSAVRLLPDSGGFPRPELGCRGPAVWALFHRGAAAGSEAYVVFRSLDGGRTWKDVLAGLDQARARLPRISAYSGPFAVLGRAAVFAGSCGACGNGRGTTTVVRTSDGGRTWHRTTLRQTGYPAAIAFPDAAHGHLIVVSQGSPVGTVLATRDGGRTWRVQLRSRRLAP